MLITHCQNVYQKAPSKLNGSNLYMFDLDGTLITTQSGNKFPKTHKDWQWIDNVIIPKLKSIILRDDHAVIIIISNQKVSKSNEKKKNIIKRKLKSIFDALTSELPDKARICLYAATGSDRYRKPSTGIFEDHVAPMLGPNTKTIIYVGDAAGRDSDFSDSDRKLAYNIQLYLNYIESPNKIKFFTPEEYFGFPGDSSKRGVWRGFDPKKYLRTDRERSDEEVDFYRLFDADGFTLILLVGPQAAGKSTYAKREFSDYYYFGLDELPRRSNYDKLLLEHVEIANKKKYPGMVIDATNSSIVHRDRWLKHSNEFDNMFILVFPGADPDTRKEYSDYVHHMNALRSRITGQEMIPEVAYRTFYKNYQTPKDDEFPEDLRGESEIIYIPHVPVTFANKKDLMYFMQWS